MKTGSRDMAASVCGDDRVKVGFRLIRLIRRPSMINDDALNERILQDLDELYRTAPTNPQTHE